MPAGPPHEVVRIHCTDHEGGPIDYQLKAVALRPVGDEFWYVFVATEAEDSWVLYFECADVPSFLAFRPNFARMTANIALRYGCAFEDLWLDLPGIVEIQRSVLDHLSGQERNELRQADLHDVWAERQNHIGAFTFGEKMRAVMLGVPPRVGRN